MSSACRDCSRSMVRRHSWSHCLAFGGHECRRSTADSTLMELPTYDVGLGAAGTGPSSRLFMIHEGS